MQILKKLQQKIQHSGAFLKRQKNRLLPGSARTEKWRAFCEERPALVQTVLIVLYRLSLDVLYLSVLSPLYAYAGFSTHVNPFYYISSLLLLLSFIPLHFRVAKQRCASAKIVIFLNYIYFIPLTSYCGCKGANIDYFLISMIYWAILLALQLRLPVVALRSFSQRDSKVTGSILTILAAVFVLYISGKYTHFRFVINVSNEYAIRAEAAGYQMSGMVFYLLSCMTIVLPVLIIFWLQKKKYWISVLLCVVFIFYFSIGAHKSQLFFLLLILGCYFFYRPWMLRWMPGLLTVLTWAALLERKLVGTYNIMTLFFRRMMFVPVLLGEQYRQFFEQNPLNLFRNGIMGKFSFGNIYTATIPYLVGEFGGDPGRSANTGIMGDLFANLPVVLGLLLLPLILILSFRFLDMATRGTPRNILIAFCIYFAADYVNSSWSTELLSGGFLLACVLLYFTPSEVNLQT